MIESWQKWRLSPFENPFWSAAPAQQAAAGKVFQCQGCGETAKSGIKPVKVVVLKRLVEYINMRPRQEVRALGVAQKCVTTKSVGFETAREELLCAKCAEEASQDTKPNLKTVTVYGY